MVKPDGVQRGLVGEIMARFERKGFQLCGLKMAQPGQAHFEKHYGDLSTKPFFPSLVKYASSGPVVAMCWEGENAVTTGRVMLGATKPSDSLPGTIRGDLCVNVSRNIIHGSDSVQSAKDELALWFKPEELQAWEHHSNKWVYEK